MTWTNTIDILGQIAYGNMFNLSAGILAFASGNAPYDDFYDSYVLTPDEVKYGKFSDNVKEMGWWVAKKAGLRTPTNLKRVSEKNKKEKLTTFEKSVGRWPIADRFIKISDKGLWEYYDAQTQEQLKKNFRENSEQEEYIRAFIVRMEEQAKANNKTLQFSDVVSTWTSIYQEEYAIPEVERKKQKYETDTGLPYEVERMRASLKKLTKQFYKYYGKRNWGVNYQTLSQEGYRGPDNKVARFNFINGMMSDDFYKYLTKNVYNTLPDIPQTKVERGDNLMTVDDNEFKDFIIALYAGGILNKEDATDIKRWFNAYQKNKKRK